MLSEKGSLVNYTLNKTQKHILEFAESVNAFQNSDVSESLNMNKNTVKVNLKKLVDIKLLSKKGIGKGTWYKTYTTNSE